MNMAEDYLLPYILISSADPSGELDVLRHNSDSLSVDGAQVGVLKQADQEGFGTLLRLKFAMEFLFNISTQSTQSMTFNNTCRAQRAAVWNLMLGRIPSAISLTRRWKGSFLMSSSVDFWYLLISRRATVPGLNL